MKPVVPQPIGGPDPDPIPVTAVPGRLRGLSGQFVIRVGDGDGRDGGVRGAGVICGKGGPDPETEAASPGRLRGLSGKYVDVDGDGRVGGVRGAGAIGGKESWTGGQRRRQRRLSHVSGDNRDDVLKFVADTNKLSRQKKGGFETGPKLHGPSTSCYLCSSGLAVCLGKGCMGKGKLYEEIGEKGCSPPASKPVTSPSPSVIPGLVLSPNR